VQPERLPVELLTPCGADRSLAILGGNLTRSRLVSVWRHARPNGPTNPAPGPPPDGRGLGFEMNDSGEIKAERVVFFGPSAQLGSADSRPLEGCNPSGP